MKAGPAHGYALLYLYSTFEIFKKEYFQIKKFHLNFKGNLCLILEATLYWIRKDKTE